MDEKFIFLFRLVLISTEVFSIAGIMQFRSP